MYAFELDFVNMDCFKISFLECSVANMPEKQQQFRGHSFALTGRGQCGFMIGSATFSKICAALYAQSRLAV